MKYPYILLNYPLLGYFSWRNINNGSWYMQSLIRELNTNGKKYDMLTLLTFVNQRVALDFESNVPATPMMDRQKKYPKGG